MSDGTIGQLIAEFESAEKNAKALRDEANMASQNANAAEVVLANIKSALTRKLADSGLLDATTLESHKLMHRTRGTVE